MSLLFRRRAAARQAAEVTIEYGGIDPSELVSLARQIGSTTGGKHMDSFPAFPLGSECPKGDLAWSDEIAEALAQEGDRLQMSFSWIKGNLQPGQQPPFDPDRIWAEVDLPALLARDDLLRFQQ